MNDKLLLGGILAAPIIAAYAWLGAVYAWEELMRTLDQRRANAQAIKCPPAGPAQRRVWTQEQAVVDWAWRYCAEAYARFVVLEELDVIERDAQISEFAEELALLPEVEHPGLRYVNGDWYRGRP